MSDLGKSIQFPAAPTHLNGSKQVNAISVLDLSFVLLAGIVVHLCPIELMNTRYRQVQQGPNRRKKIPHKAPTGAPMATLWRLSAMDAVRLNVSVSFLKQQGG